MMRRVETLIIGGGISGATALHRLASLGNDVLLLERGERLGGVLGSRRNEAGVLVESGPNSTQLTNTYLPALVDELGLRDRMLYADDAASNRYIMRDGQLLALPGGPKSFLRTHLFSASTKLRLLREPFIRPAPADEEESIAQFVVRRLGREFLDYAINPFVSGVYAGRPERLSVRYAFPKLYALEQEYRSLIRGTIAKAREKKRAKKKGGAEPQAARDRARMISFDEGMQTLPRAIEEQWRDRIETGVTVERIERHGGGWHVYAGNHVFQADRLIVATHAHGAADLLANLDPELAIVLRRIEYPPVAVAASVYPRESVEHPLDGFGVLIPVVERRGILGVIFSSTLFPNRAPDGMVLLTSFIGGARQPEYAQRDPDLIRFELHRELQRTLGISAAPVSVDLKIWPHAIPQYNIGYGEILSGIAQAEGRYPGLHLLGNYRGGVSVADCVKSGWELADKIGGSRAGREEPVMEEHSGGEEVEEPEVQFDHSDGE
jgi:oxygen-dependent protoporphyrinogen oxidase